MGGECPCCAAPSGAALESVRGAGSFPLVPYSGRLGLRRFRWQGRDHTTRAQLRRQPALAAWRRRGSSPGRSTRPATRPPSCAWPKRDGDAHWPFDFEVRQRISLTAAGAEPRCRARTRARAAQPMGLGWHPYFPKRERSRVHAEVASRWETDARSCPRAASRSRASTPTWPTSISTTASRAGRARPNPRREASRCDSPRRCRTSWSTRRGTSPTTAWSR